MNINDAYPSKYLKAADLQGRSVVVTIERVDIDKMTDGKTKPVVYFHHKEKGLVLNKTNSKKIAATYGDDTDYWSGGKIELYPCEVEFQGDTVDAIRVRPPSRVNGGQPPARPVAAPVPVATDERNPPPRTVVDLDDEIPF